MTRTAVGLGLVVLLATSAQAALGREFSVSEIAISRMVLRKTWRHVA